MVNTDINNIKGGSTVHMASDGSFVVVWGSEGQDGDRWGVYGQRFDDLGAPTGPEFQVNTTTANEQYQSCVAGAGDGSFVVVWRYWQHLPAERAIFARRYDSSGSPVGLEFMVSDQVTATDQRAPSVSVAADGSFVVAWHVDATDDVAAKMFDPQGVAVGNQFMANSSTTTAIHPDVSIASDGRFVVSYTGHLSALYFRSFTAAGVPLGPDQLALTAGQNGHWSAVSRHSASGKFVIAWEANGQDGDGPGIFAQKFTPLGMPLGMAPW